MSEVNQPARLLCHLAFVLAEALSEGKTKHFPEDWRRVLSGDGEVNRLFDMLAACDIGVVVESEDIQALLRKEPPGDGYLLISLFEGSIEKFTVEQLIEGDLANHVGVALFRERDPRWLFWRSDGYQFDGARFLDLPAWKDPPRWKQLPPTS